MPESWTPFELESPPRDTTIAMWCPGSDGPFVVRADEIPPWFDTKGYYWRTSPRRPAD